MSGRVLIFLFLALFVSCGERGAKDGNEYRNFSVPQLPSIYSGDNAGDYILDHYWNDFLGGTGKTDSLAVKGVPREQLKQAVANYIGILESFPMQRSQGAVSAFFSKIEEAHCGDTSAHLFPVFTDIVCDYLYDPNSPLRNEDYYLPFVEGLSVSPYTPEDSRPGYVFEAKMCRKNRFGEQVKNFQFRTAEGRTLDFYGIKADYTLLFFSNPGCQSCKDIIGQLCSRPYLDSMISAGRLAVVNVYIDEDLKAWREYESNYPSSWKTGYDPVFAIRGERLYNVRAIPSLYLLDEEKRIIFKDAPTEKVIEFLEKL